MNVLINTVDIEQEGGVASYYRFLAPHLSEKIQYFTVGSRSSKETFCQSLVRFFVDNIGFYRMLKDGKINLVHLNPSLRFKAIIRDAIFLVIAKRFNIKVIVFIHGWNIGCEQFIRKYFSFPFRWFYGKADAFIVLATDFKGKLIEMGIKKRIFVETTTVDQEIFLDDDDLSELKCKLDSHRQSLRILFLSRIEKEKGIYECIDAYKLLKAKYADVTLTIAGDGPEMNRVEKYVTINTIPGIEFTGYVRGDRKRSIFKASDIYFFPSRYGEGMPISVLEAMAYGLPVVTRSVGGLKDFFVNGKMGFITDSITTLVLSEYLETLISDTELRKAMAFFNTLYARENFRPSKIAERLEEIYEAVLLT